MKSCLATSKRDPTSETRPNLCRATTAWVMGRAASSISRRPKIRGVPKPTTIRGPLLKMTDWWPTKHLRFRHLWGKRPQLKHQLSNRSNKTIRSMFLLQTVPRWDSQASCRAVPNVLRSMRLASFRPHPSLTEAGCPWEPRQTRIRFTANFTTAIWTSSCGSWTASLHRTHSNFTSKHKPRMKWKSL